MQINDAKSGKRFLTYLIDMFLIGGVSQLILSLFPIYRSLLKNSQTLYSQYLNSLTDTGIIDSTIYSEMLLNAMKIQGISMLVILPIMFLYLVVLPMFWKPQTIGRLATGVRVLTIDEQAPSWKNLCLRELVGSFIFYHVLSSSIIVLIITWVFSATRGRSIADFIGGTRLINIRMILESNSTAEEKRDYVDAIFKDVDSDSSSVKEQEKKEPASNNEDDYKVF